MARTGYQEVTLITGFPSFLARRLAFHILEQEPATLLYAIVRSKLAREAEEAILAWPKGFRDRFVMLEGDAASIDLGLSGREFRALTGEIDRIHHAAQVTYLGVDRKTAHQLNVGGANEIIELARACPSLKCLIYHSTAEVSGDRTGLVREDELEAGQKFPTFVAETRAHGEKLLRRASAELPVAIMRPTTIVGDSTTGEIDRFDGPYLLILLIITSPAEIAIPLPGRGDAPLNLVPIDYVIRAARAIGRDPRAPGKTFHLVDPVPVTAQEVFESRRTRRSKAVAPRVHPHQLDQSAPPHAWSRAFCQEPARLRRAFGHPRALRFAEHQRTSRGHRHRVPSVRSLRRSYRELRPRTGAREARTSRYREHDL